MRLVYLSLAWVLGICLGSTFGLHWVLLSALIGASAVLAIVSIHRKPLLWGALCLILLFGGMLRIGSVPSGDELQFCRGFCELRGVVATDPDVRANSVGLRVEASEIKWGDGEWEDVSGTVLVYASRYPDPGDLRDSPRLRYGDLLALKGSLESPQSRDDGADFDFQEYLARQGVFSVMYSPSEVVLLDSGRESWFMSWVYDLRHSMAESLEESVSEPQCSVVEAMLLGQRGSIPAEVRDDFSRSGTSHLLAISGVHVSIVSGLALAAGVWIFGRRRPTYFVVAVAVIWLYVMLSGMSPSGVRAAIMASLWLWAMWLGRPRSAFTALSFAAAIMLAFDPRLLGNVGFQLSFAAMAGLVFLTPAFQAWGARVFADPEGHLPSSLRFLNTSCAVTLGAVLGTLPLIAFYFGQVSLMSLPATLVTLPVIPGIIVTSALVGLVGIVAPAVAGVLGWVSWLFTSYVVKAADLFAAAPMASVEVEINAPLVWGYYGIVLGVLWLPGRRNRIMRIAAQLRHRLSALPGYVGRAPGRWCLVPLAIIGALMWTAVLTASDGRLEVHILDVGQGDSILVQKSNQQVLIDGGPDSLEACRHLGNRMPFWDRTIEIVVLTHPDSDHINGLIEVLRRYDVEKVLSSGQATDSDVYREWCRLIEEKGIEHVIASPGQTIAMADGVEFRVLHPDPASVEADTNDLNDNSVVLRLEYGSFSMLLTGDAGVEVEGDLLKGNERLRSTVLKVGHHGSSTSTSAELLVEAKPMVAVISVGADNKFGHPSEEVTERLEQAVGEDWIYLTARDGTVRLRTDGQKLWVDTAR